MAKIKIATRPSRLAVIQAELVAKKINDVGFETEILKIVTEGDEGKFGISKKSAFTQRLEKALINGVADLAVHSMKDLPTEATNVLDFFYPIEDDSADCLVTKYGKYDLFDLPQGKVIGTSSIRRTSLISIYRPDLKVLELKGNVDTRLKKLGEDKFDALILSCAAIKRLEINPEGVTRLDPEYFIPAPGQGIIAVEYKKDDQTSKNIAKLLFNEKTELRARIESKFNQLMQGGCHFPAGIYTNIKGNEIILKGYFSDGERHIFSTVITNKDDYLQDLNKLATKLRNG
ncbi:MAG: hydroxymethylbilane synthase [Nitrososphaeria archaeon]|nr:hydroxymethylbilane synthase [Conexivisphaerales archaeon]